MFLGSVRHIGQLGSESPPANVCTPVVVGGAVCGVCVWVGGCVCYSVHNLVLTKSFFCGDGHSTFKAFSHSSSTLCNTTITTH